ncbi:AAA family ATPase [Magnetospirillum sulfuroxidans]|uniref:AAA family ATPase n=1 Tax=Magnetospirillum sulfuroxidans TaxID=611300 RepID=A0ABS5IB94_9PROT|nr:bifunctional aminoglycoside phosphotransferase/ATP-binding protein [Magnetospirillum sulfuroxidans]MBR9971699.1 AAA family ATPase [Magnetospirillum sulfuroxidans]
MSQDEVLRFLADPATHDGTPPERLETHISVIFLAGEKAWKLKKAVKLSFLDFSTLALRHAACLSELAVNRDAAPEIYLGVTPVTRAADGALRLGGDGEVVEWLVAMRRFGQTDLLSELLRRNQVDRALIQQVAAATWQAHQAAAHRPDKGGAAGLNWVIDTNATALTAHAHILPTARTRSLTEASRAAVVRLTPLLESRRANGKVRWCHGDLHCGNICLYQGHPTLFDAIEFSEDIACIDVFYDLAFLLMDLDHRGARILASHALNHYLDLSGDYLGVTLLPLLLSLRAAIRAHVAAAMGQADDATVYLDEALAYLSPPRPRLLAVGGLSGSGKSRMGRELAPFLAVPGAAVVRSDALRKQIVGAGLLERLPPQAYDAKTGRRTYAALYDICETLLRAGHSVVADAVFAKPEQRAAIAAVAARAGVPFDGLWLWTEPELAEQRIQERKANVSDATVDILRRQLTIDLGPMDWSRIHTGGSKDEAVTAGRAALCL